MPCQWRQGAPGAVSSIAYARVRCHEGIRVSLTGLFLGSRGKKRFVYSLALGCEIPLLLQPVAVVWGVLQTKTERLWLEPDGSNPSRRPDLGGMTGSWTQPVTIVDLHGGIIRNNTVD